MFKHKSLDQQLIDERKKNVMLKEQAEKNASDIDYIAMMSDIELGVGETEDDGNEQQV